MPAPVVRRWARGECTRCGRPADADLWCKRCADTARARGCRNAGRIRLTVDEWTAYLEALLDEYLEGSSA